MKDLRDEGAGREDAGKKKGGKREERGGRKTCKTRAAEARRSGSSTSSMLPRMSLKKLRMIGMHYMIQ